MSVTNAPEWRELVANQQALTEQATGQNARIALLESRVAVLERAMPQTEIIPTTPFVYPPPRNELRCDL